MGFLTLLMVRMGVAVLLAGVAFLHGLPLGILQDVTGRKSGSMEEHYNMIINMCLKVLYPVVQRQRKPYFRISAI